jgi:hypothetical protein
MGAVKVEHYCQDDMSMTRYVSVVDVWLLSFGIDGSVSSTANTFPAIF